MATKENDRVEITEREAPAASERDGGGAAQIRASARELPKDQEERAKRRAAQQAGTWLDDWGFLLSDNTFEI